MIILLIFLNPHKTKFIKKIANWINYLETIFKIICKCRIKSWFQKVKALWLPPRWMQTSKFRCALFFFLLPNGFNDQSFFATLFSVSPSAPGNTIGRFDVGTMKKKGKATRARFHCLSRQLHPRSVDMFNRASKRSKNGEFSSQKKTEHYESWCLAYLLFRSIKYFVRLHFFLSLISC